MNPARLNLKLEGETKWSHSRRSPIRKVHFVAIQSTVIMQSSRMNVIIFLKVKVKSIET